MDSGGPRALVMFIGTSTAGELLEIGVVEREDYQDVRIVHAMRARAETLRKAGWRDD